ncbi:MAG: hypothetical protein JO026_00275 [Patescibacteria group bacterium]|nr:hypothetical protein [Patescibacteria group bacterium]
MKKYIALYLAPVSVLEEMANATPEQAKAGMNAWMAWAKKTGSALIEMGAPLGNAKHITRNGIADAKSEVCGYSIVEAASAEEAAKLFEDHPHVRAMMSASVEVLEFMPMEDA